MLIQFIIVQIILVPMMSWHKIACIDPSVGLVLFYLFFLLVVVARWLSFRFYLWSHLYCVRRRRPQRVIMCTMHLFLYIVLFHSCYFFIPFIHLCAIFYFSDTDCLIFVHVHVCESLVFFFFNSFNFFFFFMCSNTMQINSQRAVRSTISVSPCLIVTFEFLAYSQIRSLSFIFWKMKIK